jgi:hypothetical protein
MKYENTQQDGEAALIEQIQTLQRQLSNCLENDPTPVLVEGTVKTEADIAEQLRYINTSPDHLLLVAEILTTHMWKETEFGMPRAHREQLIMEVQQDIRDMYELANIAKYLGSHRGS